MADLTPLSLWMTDRSRYETGTGHCQRDRYLSYHAGPHGYGWAKRAQSIPLVTGMSLAQIQEALHRQILVDNGMVPDEATYYRWIQQAVAAYQKVVADRGLSNVVDATELALRTREQLTLLEGLAWVWYYVGLPALLEQWTILGVEDEETSVLGCTCGLGDRLGTPEEHDARGCNGIVYMTRGDLICQAKDGSARYSYHEFKAPSETNINTDAAWEYRVQLLSGVIGAEDRRGIRIDEIWVQQLIKGKRQSEWDAEQGKAVGPKYQNSPLVYGWRRPANPPLQAEDWRVKHKYVDELGKNRKLTKDYARTPIWEMTFEPGTGALSPSHAWVQWMGYDALVDSYRPIGPIQRNDDRRDQFLRQLLGKENRWKETL